MRGSRPIASAVGHRLIDAVMVVLLLAGLGKLLDLPSFAASMATWELIPDGVAPAVAVFVPSLEVAVALAWFLRAAATASVMAAAGLLAAFTVLYIIHLVFFRQPHCDCLGVILRLEALNEHAGLVIARNLLLLFALWVGRRLAATPPASAPHSDAEANAASSPRRSNAFTLLETILVVATVGVLIATLAPHLAGTRSAARSAGASANLRSHAAVFSMYHNDWADVYPYFTDPDSVYTILRSQGRAVTARYFSARFYWPFALAEDYYDGNLNHPSFRPPGYRGGSFSAFNYSMSFLANYRYWNWSTRTGPEQWGPVRADEVSFPSVKGLLINWASAEVGTTMLDFNQRGQRFETAFCDGSARSFADADFLRPVLDGEGPWGFPPNVVGHPVIHTVDGSRGRDVR